MKISKIVSVLSLTLVLIGIFELPAQAQSVQPIIRYSFEPTTRNTTTSKFKNLGQLPGYDAAIQGFVSETDGIFGKGVFLHGNAGLGDGLIIPGSKDLFHSLDSFTVAMWLNPDAVGYRERSYQAILGFSYQRPNVQPLGFGGKFVSVLCGAGFPYVQTSIPGISDKCGSGESRPPVTGASVPLPNQFYHYAFSYSQGVCKSFVNGVEFDSWTCTSAPKTLAVSDLAVGLGDGAFNGDLPSVHVTGYRGKIDDFQIFNTALNDGDIKQLAASSLTTCGDNVCSVYESEFSCPADCSQAGLSSLIHSSSDISIWSADSLTKLTPNTPPPAGPEGSIAAIELGKNETRTTQIAFKTTQATSVPILVSAPAGISVRTYQQEAIEIKNVGWPYFYKGKIYDGLRKLNEVVSSGASETQALLLEVATLPTTAPGSYSVEISIAGRSLVLPVRVLSFSLPTIPTFKTALDSGHLSTRVDGESCVGKSMYDFHGVSSEADKDDVARAYLSAYSDFKVAPYHVHMDSFFSFDCNTQEFNFDRFDQAMGYGVDAAKISNVFLLRYNGLDQSLGFPLCGLTIQDPGYRALMNTYFTKLVAHLRANGWIDSANSEKSGIAIMLDEPGYKNSAENAEVWLRWARGYLPKEIKLAITLNSFNLDRFKGIVDIVISTNNPRDVTSGNPEAAAQFVRDGGELWWYETESNRMTSDGKNSDLTGQMWVAWKYGVKGFLYWAGLIGDRHCAPTDFRLKNTTTDVRSIWGNSATNFFIAPCGADACQSKNTEVIPTLRLLSFREGIQDYEYLIKLDELIALASSFGLETQPARALRVQLADSITDHKKLGNLSALQIAQSRAALRGQLESLSTSIHTFLNQSNTNVVEVPRVNNLPVLKKNLKNMTVRRGKNTTMSVQFENFVKIVWYKNGRIVNSWRTQKVKITKAALKHSARYKVCAMSNDGSKLCSRENRLKVTGYGQSRL